MQRSLRNGVPSSRCAVSCQPRPVTLRSVDRASGLYFRAPLRCRATPPVASSSDASGAIGLAVKDVLEAASKAGATAARIEYSKVEAQMVSLIKAGADLNLNHVELAVNEGDFEGLLTTDTRQVDESSNTTLGRMTFGKACPVDLSVQLNDTEGKAITGLPDQSKGPFEGVPQSYVVNAHFKVFPSEEDGASPAPLHGLMNMIGRFEIAGADQPQRLTIMFDKIRLRPADPSNQLEAWLKAMAGSNPDMRKEDGVLEILLPVSPKGSLDYIVMDENWHITRGNLGSVVVMKRRSVA